MHALHYANELLVRVRLSFQSLLQTRSTCRKNTKNVWGKSNDAQSLSIRVQNMIKHISICFLPQYQHQRKCFFFFSQSASWKRYCATRWREQGWTLIDNGLVTFDWFVPSMHMQVILDSSFRPPGFSSYMGREERRVQGLDHLFTWRKHDTGVT